MAKAELYNIYLKHKPSVTAEEIKKQMDLSLDWYKYADQCWIVETTSTPEKWLTRLKPLAEPGGFLFICKIDASVRQGWMATSFWEWLKPKAEKKKSL